MIAALLRGKLSREQENLEDILTSNVFGVLQYLPPSEGLLPFLAQSRPLSGEKPLAFLSEVTGAKVGYEFWPWWPPEEDRNGCEPDLVLRITTAERKLMVLVEAKFRSGKSSEADERPETPLNDQLAREWDHLTCRAKPGEFESVLVFLTADAGLPRPGIEASVREYRDKRPGDTVPPAIYWLSWRLLIPVFAEKTGKVYEDLLALAERLNLILFGGFSHVEQVAPLQWSFGGGDDSADLFGWGDVRPVAALQWKFEV